MPSPSAASTTIAVALLLVCATPASSAPPEPIAILIQANGVRIDDQAASVGLSVFEGERVQTDTGGSASLRLGKSSLALMGNSAAELMRLSSGIHLDLTAGTVRFSADESQVIEVHAEDATIRTLNDQATDATVTILQPKVLQIDARRGSLNFTYRQEFRMLPEGQVYRIYLDTLDRSDTETSVGGEAGQPRSKVGYYIVGAGAAAGFSWITYEAVHSGNHPISPAKP